MTRLAPLLLIPLLAGCASSLDELRESPVKRVESYAVPYGPLATCSNHRFEYDTRVDLEVWEDLDGGSIRLTAFRAVFMRRPHATFEFILFRDSSRTTRVEFRNDDWTDLQPTRVRLSDAMWRAITLCSQSDALQTYALETAPIPPGVPPK